MQHMCCGQSWYDGIAHVCISLLAGSAPGQLLELPAASQRHSSAGVLNSVLHMGHESCKVYTLTAGMASSNA